MDRQKEFVLRTLEERDIRFVRLWFTDVLGYLKSVAIAPAELEGAFEEGIGFDGSSIEGFARVSEADMVARPDPSTFQVLPWTDQRRPAPLGADVLRHHDARRLAVLGRLAARAAPPAGQGQRSRLLLLRPPRDRVLPARSPARTTARAPVPADNGGYFDQAVHDSAPNFRRHAIDALEPMGISVEFSHHEGAPGQQEIDLRYADALSMADNVMTFRYLVKEVALGEGVRASFMPKPFAEYPGSAMHTHMSLFEGDTNAFHSPDDPLQLSDVGKSFIAGILEHATEISAVTNQWVNSYKRLVHGGEAPTAASWGAANRSALVRVPMYTPHKASSRRVEVRSPDSACNPYLAFAVLLAAGLRGIEKGYVLGPQAEDNVWSLTPEERRAMGYQELPGSLGVALTEMESSELVAEALGEHVFDFFLRNKRAEWENYRSHVTPFELKNYLSLCTDAPVALPSMGVAKPATQRPGCPASGGSGSSSRPHMPIWHRSAGTPTPTSSCCGRCRAPPTRTPRCARSCGCGGARDRLARTRRGAAQGPQPAGPAVRACSARRWRSATTWSPTRDSWHLLAGNVALPSAEELRRDVRRAWPNQATGATAAIPPLRTLYRDQLLVLAALDLAPTVENEPVLPFTVGRRTPVRSRRRRAGRGAARGDARRCAATRTAPATRRHRDGQMRCARTQLRQRRRRHLRRRDGAHSNLALATRIAGEMMRMASEAFFEVDAALRPEGKQGQLVRTLESHVAYYERWAKTWEFQALLKARPAAGDCRTGPPATSTR